METFEPYSPDAAAMLAALGKDELYEVTQTGFDFYCDLNGITGGLRWALEEERAAYLIPPDNEIRMQYLADPGTDIHWGWLLACRTNLFTKNKRAKAHALDVIRMMTRHERVPADVRAAAGVFLTALAEAKPTDLIPAITAPDSEKWKTMSDEELYRRLDALRQRLNNAAEGRHGSE